MFHGHLSVDVRSYLSVFSGPLCFVATYLYVQRLYYHLELQEAKEAQEESESDCLTTSDHKEAGDHDDATVETMETDDWVVVNKYTSDMD